MVKLKNYTLLLKHFILLLTFLTFISCAEKKYAVTKIEAKEIGITDKNVEVVDWGIGLNGCKAGLRRRWNCPALLYTYTLTFSSLS